MSEETKSEINDQTTTPPADTEKGNAWESVFSGMTPDQVKNEIEKWKHFSRKHEDELNQLKKANMTEAERAIEDAKAQARAEVAAEFEKERLQLKLEAAAASAGVPKEVLNLVDPSKLVVDGEVQMELLSSLAAPKTPQFTKSASDLGIGAQTTSGAGQLTRADLARMTPAEINKAREEGKLNDLMQGRM